MLIYTLDAVTERTSKYRKIRLQFISVEEY